MSNRKQDLDRFYSLLSQLEEKWPKRTLSNSHGRMEWFEQGVYFFFEENEVRECNSPRVVRIGTHAVAEGSKTKLWTRLRQHKGTNSGEGNHRFSVFRKLIGKAIIRKNKLCYPEWGERKKRGKQTILAEKEMERKVSENIGKMPFLCLEISGESKKDNMRAYIETNSIALLSNRKGSVIDKSSKNWLGKHSQECNVIKSGLWNRKDTEKSYKPEFLDQLEKLIKR